MTSFRQRFPELRPDDGGSDVVHFSAPPIVEVDPGTPPIPAPVVVVPRAFPDDEIVDRFKRILGREPTEGQYWALKGVSMTENIDPHIMAYKYAADTATAERDFITRKFQNMVGSPPTDSEFWTLVGLNQQGEPLDAHIMGMKARRPPLQPVGVVLPTTPVQPTISLRGRPSPSSRSVRVAAGRIARSRPIGRTLKALQILLRGR